MQAVVWRSIVDSWCAWTLRADLLRRPRRSRRPCEPPDGLLLHRWPRSHWHAVRTSHACAPAQAAPPNTIRSHTQPAAYTATLICMHASVQALILAICGATDAEILADYSKSKPGLAPSLSVPPYTTAFVFSEAQKVIINSLINNVARGIPYNPTQSSAWPFSVIVAALVSSCCLATCVNRVNSTGQRADAC